MPKLPHLTFSWVDRWPEAKWKHVLAVAVPEQRHDLLRDRRVIGVMPASRIATCGNYSGGLNLAGKPQVGQGLVDAVVAVIVAPDVNVLVLVADEHAKVAKGLAV